MYRWLKFLYFINMHFIILMPVYDAIAVINQTEKGGFN